MDLVGTEGHMPYKSISLNCHDSLFLFLVIGSIEVREVPYDAVKIHELCFVIFPFGIDGVFIDISLHIIRII